MLEHLFYVSTLKKISVGYTFLKLEKLIFGDSVLNF